MSLDTTKTLYHILAPMESVEPPQIRRVAAELRQRRGEYTACAQVIERALEALHPTDSPAPEPEKPLGIDTAYGDMSLPLGHEWPTSGY